MVLMSLAFCRGEEDVREIVALHQDVVLLRRSHAVLDVVRVIVVEDVNPAVTPPFNDANTMG